MTRSAPSRAFWRHFKTHHWLKAPLHQHNPRLPFRIAPDELFAALVSASEASQGGSASGLVRFFIEDALVSDATYLPARNDSSLDAYVQRLEGLLKGRKFGLIVNALQGHSFILWSVLRDFLQGFYQSTGAAPYVAEAGLFFGNYESTAFGVHHDQVDVMMFVLRGCKTMRFWEPTALALSEVVLHRHAYQPLLARSACARAEAGDFVYWPAGHWHVGESDGLSLTLNVALGTRGGTAANPTPISAPSEVMAAAVQSLLRDASSPQADSVQQRDIDFERLGTTALSLSRALRTAIKTLRERMEDGELDCRLLATELSRLTGFGFRPVPALPPPRSLSPEMTVQGDSRFPIVWARAGMKLVLAANGRAMTSTFHPAIVRMLRRLNQGTPVQVSELVQQRRPSAKAQGVAAQMPSKDLLKLLEGLFRFRALALSVSAPTSRQSTNKHRGALAPRVTPPRD